MGRKGVLRTFDKSLKIVNILQKDYIQNVKSKTFHKIFCSHRAPRIAINKEQKQGIFRNNLG